MLCPYEEKATRPARKRGGRHRGKPKGKNAAKMAALQEVRGGWRTSAILFGGGERKRGGAENSSCRAVLHEGDDVEILAFPIAGQAQIRRGGESTSRIRAAQNAKFANDGAMVHVRTGILAGGHIRGEIVFRNCEKDIGAMFGVPAAEGLQAYTQKHGLRARCRVSTLLDLKVCFRGPRGLRNGRK